MERKYLIGLSGVLIFLLALISKSQNWLIGVVLPMVGMGMAFLGWLMHISESMSTVSREQQFYIPTSEEKAALERAKQQAQSPNAQAPNAQAAPPKKAVPITKAELDAKLAALRAMEAAKKAAANQPPN